MADTALFAGVLPDQEAWRNLALQHVAPDGNPDGNSQVYMCGVCAENTARGMAISFSLPLITIRAFELP